MNRNNVYRVLVIEKGNFITGILEESGRRFNNKVVCFPVSDIRQLAEKAAENSVDVVICDMFSRDGTNIIEYPGEWTASLPLPVVGITGCDTIESLSCFGTPGFADCIPHNQVTPWSLLKAIKCVLKLHEYMKEIREGYERYDLAIQAADESIWDVKISPQDGDKTFRDIRTYKKLFGYDLADFSHTADFWERQLHPDDQERVLAKINNVLYKERGSVWEDEYRFRRADGSYAYVRDRACVIYDNQNSPTRMVGVTQDITESRRIMDELEGLSIIARETVNGVIILDCLFNIIWVNEGFTRITGYTLDDVAGKSPDIFVQRSENAGHELDYICQQVARNEMFACEMRSFSKGNCMYWVYLQGHPVVGKTGNPAKYFILVTDITTIRKAEQKLSSYEKKYSSFINNSNEGFAVVDYAGVLLEISDPGRSILGIRDDHYAGGSFLSFIREDYRERVGKFLTGVASGTNSEYIFEFPVESAGSGVKWLESSFHNLYAELGCQEIVLCFRDITEKMARRRRTQKEQEKKRKEIVEAVLEAQEKERLEIGMELHDNVNQILAATKLMIDASMMNRNDTGLLLCNASNHLTRAIEEIRKLSKVLSGSHIDNVGLIPAIEGLINDLSVASQLIIDFQADDIPGLSLEKKMKINLFRIVQEQLSNVVKHARACNVQVQMNYKYPFIDITIEDDGKGFRPEEKRQGIGLSNIINRVQLYKGTVNIISSPGHGCRMEIRIPLGN